MKMIFKEVKNTVTSIGVAVYAILIIVVGNILFKICYVTDFIRGKNPMDRVNNTVTYVKEKSTDTDDDAISMAVLKALFWPMKV